MNLTLNERLWYIEGNRNGLESIEHFATRTKLCFACASPLVRSHNGTVHVLTCPQGCRVLQEKPCQRHGCPVCREARRLRIHQSKLTLIEGGLSCPA
jgi:hypothetical protein